ncbi:hypothetical protein SDC9_07932 [bioreactor metagenome]|uniref:Polymerase beta nucleotidyltransferase domain-containing protein n=1 Tax=bioreactor metagenome TaxID=1076179 RepID=A0A644T5X7_9ZZZZ|nr:hypothetical protein [Candidatus Elulimicrobiales bacterium]
MDSLVKIFQANNGDVRLKVLRFFLVNDKESFSIDDVEFNTKTRRDPLKKDLLFLAGAGFLERRLEKNTSVYRFNQNFEYKEALYNLVFDLKNLNKKIILDKFKKIGRIKLFSLTGVFIEDTDIDLDILVVVDILKPKEANKITAELDATFASKLKVLIMDIEEFNYRKKMFDRFLHLVLDSQRITLIDKLSDKI